MGFLSRDELLNIGFKTVGVNVHISEFARFYNPGNIEIGNDVRIDDFCVLSAGEGGIVLGNNIHIAVYTSLIGAGKITLSDFCNLSSRVSIYSSNDDYSGRYMTNPTVHANFTNVHVAPVHLGDHVIIGSGCVILPGVNILPGVAVGALSLIKSNCDEFWIYAGNPAKKIKERSRALLDLEKQYTVGK